MMRFAIPLARALAIGAGVHVVAAVRGSLDPLQSLRFASIACFAALAVDAIAFLVRKIWRATTMTTTTSNLVCDGVTLDPVTTTSPAGTPAAQHFRDHANNVCEALAAAGCSCDELRSSNVEA